MNTSSGHSAAEHTGRTHVGPRKNDSLWYKAKVVSPIASLLLLVIGVTWAFTAYDKRLTVLEISDAAQEAQIKTNTASLTDIDRWIPTADLKFDLLLQHFGIAVPEPKK